MTGPIELPASVDPGPTKPEIRAVTLQKLALQPTDHFVDVGAGSGAMSVAAGRAVSRVTAIERDADRVQAIRSNFRANDVDVEFTVLNGEAPATFPDTADSIFIGGTRRFEAVLEEVQAVGARRVVMNAARLQTATAAVDAFEVRDLLESILTLRIDRGYELGDETGFRGDNPVFMIVGSRDASAGLEASDRES